MNRNPWKSRRSIFTTQTISYLLLILVISVTFGLFFFSTAKNHLEREVGRKLQDIASIAAKNAPFERLDLIKIGDDETRMVLRLKEKLGEIQEATGVDNIFIFRPDKTSLLDLRPNALIGTVYALPHFNETLLNDLERGKAVSTGSYRSPSGNLYISAYAPVLDSKNKLFAVVGVDAGTREIEVIEQMRTRLYMIAGLGAVFAFILALILARRLTNPIRDMAKTAELIGMGNYDARVPIPSIAELGVLANSINTMAQQVQSRDVKLKEISASVAHEIRNPLNSLNLLITLLEEELREQQDKTQVKTIETLRYEIGKLNRFLSEFLTYSRPINLFREEVNPAELAKSAVEMVAAEAKEKEVEVSVVYGDDLPYIYVDRQRLEQSLLNIILNAVQASEQRGCVKVQVARARKGQYVDFIVEDYGPGIPGEVMEKIFEPFFTTKGTGSGLGLPNAKKIVASHGGEIIVENIQKGGARFTIRIPLGIPHSQGD